MIKNKKIFCFDIDNVICKTIDSDYSNSKPNKKVIKLINCLYKNENTIKIFTSRYMGRNYEDYNLVKKKYLFKTKKQLDSWGVKYHYLILGKPSYDLFVDDRAFGFSKNWLTLFKKRFSKYLLNLKDN